MKFKEIIGQEEIKQRLIRTIKDNRVSHAQLFSGPEGSGKLALAIAYAQYINCRNKLNNDSCGVCPSCIKYEKLIHPDLHFIYPVATTKEITKKPLSKNFIKNWRNILIKNEYYLNLNEWYEEIGIEKKQAIINTDDCSEIIRTLNYKTYEAEYKVMIIWMVEKLFHSAAPKILKILEEPPEKTLFILISENQDQIISTILSRTQLIKIPKIKNEDLLNKMELSGYDAKNIITQANGNYKEALRLINQTDEEKFNYNNFTKWMRLCFKNKISDIIDFISEISLLSRERHKSFFLYSLRIIRESLLINNNCNSLVKLNNEETAFIKKFYPYVNSANGIQLTEELNKALFHTERNANSKILFMDLSLKIHKLLQLK
ncbi:MAG: DNA polymerase III subunit delta [Bacteroidales bacterium]|nr:DNA polymerase III subunit delta [Bacteroidales bacterium]